MIASVASVEYFDWSNCIHLRLLVMSKSAHRSTPRFMLKETGNK